VGSRDGIFFWNFNGDIENDYRGEALHDNLNSLEVTNVEGK
jgi:hypothetical protein